MLVLTKYAAIAGLAATAFTTATVLADPWWAEPPNGDIVAGQRTAALEPFDATGLPAGSAKGIPQRATLPPGFNLKQVHGGPSYVYVISSSLDITGTDGRTATYQAGDFFWEPVGRLHTAKTSERTEVFILRFVTPGAEGTIPVE